MTKVSELPSYSGTPSAVVVPGNVGGVTYGLSAEQIAGGGAQGFVFVSDKTDLPDAVAGVITLVAETTYFFTQDVDLAGDRLVCSQDTVITGGSSENATISSTGLSAGTALLSSAYSLPMRHVALTHDIAVDLDADGNPNQALDWTGVNFLNCTNMGTIANYNNVILNVCAALNSSGLTFDGTIGTVGINNTLIDTASGGTGIIIPATANITRRFRIIYSAFVTLSGETGLDVSTSATIPVEGYILDTVNFAGGGTYTAGVPFDDNKALFSNNVGVENSASVGLMTMQGNATATVINSVGVAEKAAGTTTLQTSVSQKFSHSDNRLTYVGAITRKFRVSAVASMLAGNNHQLGSYIAKNGSILSFSEIYTTASGSGRSENVSIQAIVELSENDYVEFFVENDTSTTNVTVEDLSVIVEAV